MSYSFFSQPYKDFLSSVGEALSLWRPPHLFHVFDTVMPKFHCSSVHISSNGTALKTSNFFCLSLSVCLPVCYHPHVPPHLAAIIFQYGSPLTCFHSLRGLKSGRNWNEVSMILNSDVILHPMENYVFKYPFSCIIWFSGEFLGVFWKMFLLSITECVCFAAAVKVFLLFLFTELLLPTHCLHWISIKPALNCVFIHSTQVKICLCACNRMGRERTLQMIASDCSWFYFVAFRGLEWPAHNVYIINKWISISIKNKENTVVNTYFLCGDVYEWVFISFFLYI